MPHGKCEYRAGTRFYKCALGFEERCTRGGNIINEDDGAATHPLHFFRVKSITHICQTRRAFLSAGLRRGLSCPYEHTLGELKNAVLVAGDDRAGEKLALVVSALAEALWVEGDRDKQNFFAVIFSPRRFPAARQGRQAFPRRAVSRDPAQDHAHARI